MKNDPSELEKYFTLGLGATGSAMAPIDAGAGDGSSKRRTSYANEESEYSDTFSETSSSIYSEGLESVERSGGEEDDVDPVELASSRLEKYFMTNFLGLEGSQYPFPVAGRTESQASDGSESVGSDSEGHPSPEQRRRKVMKTRQGRGLRQQASAGSDPWSHNRAERKESGCSDVSASSASELRPHQEGNDVGDAETATGGVGEAPNGSSSSSDASDLLSSEEEEIVFEKTDGQYDTIKRRKKKRSAGDHDHERAERQDKPMAMDDRLASVASSPLASTSAAPTDATPTLSTTDKISEATAAATAETAEGKSEGAVSVADGAASNAVVEDLTTGLDPNCPRKYQSRDSGFVGSCDDLLNETSMQKEIRKRLSSDSGSSDGADGDKSASKLVSVQAAGSGANVKVDEGDTKSAKSVGSNSSSVDQGGSLTSTSHSSKSGKLSRKDSFNNWSSDEETNLMVNKMRAFFRNMVSASATKGENENGERVKPPQLVAFENELTRLMKSVPGINDQQVKEIVEYLSSEDTWSDSYDSSDYTSSDLEGAYAVLDPTLPELDVRSDLQQQISASCQEIIEKFDLDRSPEGSGLHMDAAGVIPWLPVGEDASNSLNKETAFVYQRLVNSLMRLNSGPKTANSTTDATTAAAATEATAAQSGYEDARSGASPHSSPPMIAKVLHHIGNRLVALMHEVSASSDTTSHSGSIDEDAQSPSRIKGLAPVTSSPRMTKIGRLFLANSDHHSSTDDKRSLSTSVDSENTPTDTEHSPTDSSDDNQQRTSSSGRIKSSATDAGVSKYGFESLHTYEKRMSSLPSHLGGGGGNSSSSSSTSSTSSSSSSSSSTTTNTNGAAVEGRSRGAGEERDSSSVAAARGFSSLEGAEPSRGVIGGSRSLKARLAERARTLDAERRRQQAEEKRLVEEEHTAEDDAADEDRYFKKERKLPRFSLFRTTRETTREALQSSSSGVSDIAEEKEDEFSGWRSSFESAIAADSRTKLSLEAKRRSAGSASSSELFASSELLDRDSRRVRSSGHSSKFSLPNLLERDALRMAKERERERSASSDVLLSTSPLTSNAMLSVIDQQEDEDTQWDRLVITRLSSKRRSSVPDTREDRNAERDQPRSTTLPRSTTALNAVDHDELNIDVLGASSPSISASTAGVKKSLSLLLSNSSNGNSASESSLNTSVDTPVKSARYRPPGFRPAATETQHPQHPVRPQRTPSTPSALGLNTTQVAAPRLATSAASLSGGKTVRSLLAGTLFPVLFVAVQPRF